MESIILTLAALTLFAIHGVLTARRAAVLRER